MCWNQRPNLAHFLHKINLEVSFRQKSHCFGESYTFRDAFLKCQSYVTQPLSPGNILKGRVTSGRNVRMKCLQVFSIALLAQIIAALNLEGKLFPLLRSLIKTSLEVCSPPHLHLGFVRVVKLNSSQAEYLCLDDKFGNNVNFVLEYETRE